MPTTAHTTPDDRRRDQRAQEELVGERIGERAEHQRRPARRRGGGARSPARLVVVVGVVEQDRLLAEDERGGRRTSARGRPGRARATTAPWATTVRFIATTSWKCWRGAGEVVGRGDDRPARLASASRRSRRSSWVVMSTPVTGSSRRYRSGSAARARARKTRRRWPPDSEPIWVRAWSAMPTCVERLRARRRDPRGPGRRSGPERAGSDPSSRRPRRSPGSPSRRSRPGARRRRGGPRRPGGAPSTSTVPATARAARRSP